MAERVNHPDYYNKGPKIILTQDYSAGEELPIECIDVIRDMPAWKAMVIKYLWRCGLKEEEGLSVEEKEFEDMLKAYWYLGDKIEKVRLKQKYKNG